MEIVEKRMNMADVEVYQGLQTLDEAAEEIRVLHSTSLPTSISSSYPLEDDGDSGRHADIRETEGISWSETGDPGGLYGVVFAGCSKLLRE